MAFAPPPAGAAVLWVGIPIILAGSLLGLPIFATLGGIALLLFWNAGLPVASVPVETYRLVASPVLPSLPLFTLAGYLLVEGGASVRLLRVYTALFGWLPGGLAITTAVGCAIFTWAGSGVTILSMGGLLLPMLVKARYPQAVLHRADQRVGLAGAAFSSKPAGDPLRRLFPDGHQYAFRGRVRSGPVDGGDGLGLGRGSGFAKRSGARQLLVSRSAKGNLGRQMGDCGSIHRPHRTVWRLRHAGGSGRHHGGLHVPGGMSCFRRVFFVRDFPRVVLECVTVVGGVLMIIGVAVGLTSYLVAADVPTMLVTWVDAHIHSKYVFLLLLNLVLLVKGSFMDVFSAIIVMVPLITPMARALRHRSGATGHHLFGESGTGIFDAAHRHESLPLRVSFQAADDGGIPRHAAGLSDSVGGSSADHLRPGVDFAAGEMVWTVSRSSVKRSNSPPKYFCKASKKM